MKCVIIDDLEANFYDPEIRTVKHIKGIVPTNNTLCGWVDVSHHEVDGKPNCSVCLEVVRFCKRLKL
jgi:hypothetical protein